jgi:hypothetical protein
MLYLLWGRAIGDCMMPSDSPMRDPALRNMGWLDRAAIILSGLCIVHCVATLLVLALLASAGSLLNPAIHEAGLLLAMVLAVLALGRGFLVHRLSKPLVIGSFGIALMAGAMTLPEGAKEAAFTIIGVGLVGVAHFLNRRALS